MAGEDGVGFASSAATAVILEVLRQHGPRARDYDVLSRKAEESASRRHEAADWLRRTMGIVSSKDLPEEPTEEEFRLSLNSGIILCCALNKVQPGAVPKVVESPASSVVVVDSTLTAYQYFENVRNFLVAVQQIGIPAFEACDLEMGGKCAKVVDCVLALKSYAEWKQAGGIGSWKYGGGPRTANSGRLFVRKQAAEPFGQSSIRNMYNDNNSNQGREFNEMATTGSLSTLVRSVLSNKKSEEIPALLESILGKIMEEFERCKPNSQNEPAATNKVPTKSFADSNKLSKRKVLAELAPAPAETKKVDENLNHSKECCTAKPHSEESKAKLEKGKLILEKQEKDIKDLKQAVVTTKAGLQFMKSKYSEDLCNLGKQVQGLALAASGYHRVLEENRALYNQVQDLKGSIRVYCRVRPFLPGPSIPASTVGHLDDETVSIMTPSKYGKEGQKFFRFNKVFAPSATQDEVFADTRPLIRSVLDGYNVCIFAYGQTGSGKTYTMSGPNEITTQSQGVNYRALNDLFFLSEQRKGIFSYEIAVQMLEIYNEQVRDLLASDEGLNKRLEIRNSSQNGPNVPDAKLVPVASPNDVLELMKIGQKNRSVGATALNERSSRSHSCLTVHVQGKDLTTGTILRGCMHLVDLAGSERVNKSEVTGERLKEAQHINKSLSALGDVIAGLAQKNSHVPYRNSKLTQLLQDSLGGQAKTLMFVHINPEADAVSETISTLKFAERVSTVELGAARVNKEGADVKELKEQIASLKEALACKQGNTPIQKLASLQRSTPNSDLRKLKTGRTQPYATREKKVAIDSQEPLTTSDWTISSGKDDEKEMTDQEWVDKMMVNKQDDEESTSTDWQEGDTPLKQLPQFFYQRPLDPKVILDNRVVRKEGREADLQRFRSDATVTDDSDDFDMATSDSSEADAISQCNSTSRFATPPVSGSGSRLKKPQARPPKSPEIRTPVRSHGPSPSRKVLNASFQTPNRVGRQVVDMKRQSSTGKLGGHK